VRARTWVAVALAVAVLSAGAVLLAAAAHEPAAGSTLSRAAGGWMAARRYLEARGAQVTLVDSVSASTTGVLAIVFPWQRADFGRPAWSFVDDHAGRGGTVIFAYSGRPDPEESDVASRLGMTGKEGVDEPPLHPLRWREYRMAVSALTAAEGSPGVAPLRVATPRVLPTAPVGAHVLFRDERGRAAVFWYPWRQGRVVALPARLFDNAGLEDAGNADFLESLGAGLGPEWSFDEFHHGLASAAAVEADGPGGWALDLFLLQMALVYALAVLAVSRRFGPPWQEPPVVTGSTTSFLRGVGALHHRLGHHRAAGETLVARARQLHPRLELHDAGGGHAGAEGFLRLAQAVGRAQSGEEHR
jgi:hypothetical protein